MREPAAELGANGLPLWNGYTCPRDRDLRASYGLTLADWQAAYELQGGCCGICGKPFTDKRRAVVDHQHDPPHLVRGLLCDSCNRKLSEALLAYLADPPAAKVASGPLYVPPERERARVAKLTARKEKAKAEGGSPSTRPGRRKGKRTPAGSGQVAASIDHLEGDLVNDALAELDIGERVRRAMNPNGYARQIQRATEPSDYQAKVNRALAETAIRDDHARRNGHAADSFATGELIAPGAKNSVGGPVGPAPRRRRWRWW
jgi:hypothetical protein